MNKIKFTAIFASLCIAAPNCAYAGIDRAVCEDYETGRCVISGNINDTQKDTALFRCIKPGHNPTDADAYVEFGEIEIAGDGSFSHTFYINGETGTYVAGVSSGGIVLEKSFVFVNSTEVDIYIAAINAAETSQQMQNVFEDDYGRLLKICGISYDDLNITDIEYFYECILQSVPQGGFQTLKDIKQTVSQCAIFNGFSDLDKTQADNAIKSLFEFFDEKYNSVIRLYNDGDIINDTVKQTIIDSIQENSFNSMERFQKIFAETVLYNSLYYSSNIAQKSKILEISKDYIISDYNFREAEYYYSLYENDKNAILTAVTGIFTNTAGFLDLLSDTAAIYKNRDTNSSISVGGSSGGGGVKSVSPGNISQTVSDIKRFGFSDTDSVPWAKTAIDSLYAKGIVSGIEENRFAPDKSITREEYVTMLVKIFNPQSSGEMKNFSDVDESKWYAPYIRSAYLGGFISGVSETMFGTGELITRQDAALMCYNAATVSGYSIDFAAETQAQFTDYDEIADYAKNSVEKMYRCGIISGMGNNMFIPAGNLTRAQAACMIYSLCRYIGIM